VPTASLTAPNGPAGLPACTPATITWSAGDNVGVAAIDLYYSDDCGATYPHIIATNLPNSGSFTWNPPVAAGPGYKVMMVARDAAGLRGVDASDNCFPVTDTTPPAVAITGPKSGEVWTIGQTRTTAWTATDACGSVDSLVVSLSRNGGTSWVTLGVDEANDGSLSWTVTGPATASAKIRVQAFDRTYEGVAVSEAFRIQDGVPPTAQVVSPNGGELLPAGSSHPIDYLVSDATGLDRTCLEYSMDNGASWTAIECTTNGSQYMWTLPTGSSDSCLVRVTAYDVDGNTTADVSDAVFRIVSQAAAHDMSAYKKPTLFQNWPNPFNPVTTVSFYMPSPGVGELAIYDLSGRKIRTLATGDLSAGYQEISWDGRDDSGQPLASGMFFYVLEAGAVREVRKMVMSK
jgi:hypothetical protein